MTKYKIKKALDAIAAADKHVAIALKQVGYPSLRLQANGFETLLGLIVNQQLSTKAAQTILTRVKALLPQCDAQSVLKLSDQMLRDAGLSWRKVEYAKGLARAIDNGSFSPDALVKMNDEDAIAAITQLRGFGRWSAENYLIFCLGREDIFPADDLIIQTSLQKIKRMRNKPSAEIARQKVKKWAPWRSAGALFLWYAHEGEFSGF